MGLHMNTCCILCSKVQYVLESKYQDFCDACGDKLDLQLYHHGIIMQNVKITYLPVVFSRYPETNGVDIGEPLTLFQCYIHLQGSDKMFVANIMQALKSKFTGLAFVRADKVSQFIALDTGYHAINIESFDIQDRLAQLRRLVAELIEYAETL